MHPSSECVSGLLVGSCRRRRNLLRVARYDVWLVHCCAGHSACAWTFNSPVIMSRGLLSIPCRFWGLVGVCIFRRALDLCRLFHMNDELPLTEPKIDFLLVCAAINHLCESTSACPPNNSWLIREVSQCSAPLVCKHTRNSVQLRVAGRFRVP